MGNTCKLIGYIWSIFGFISSIILAYSYGKVRDTYHFLGSTQYSSERNWLLTILIFMISLLSVAVISVILFALSEVLFYLESLKHNMNSIRSANNNLAGNDNKTDVLSLNNNAAYWICKECSTKNSNTVISCKNCGTYK